MRYLGELSEGEQNTFIVLSSEHESERAGVLRETKAWKLKVGKVMSEEIPSYVCLDIPETHKSSLSAGTWLQFLRQLVSVGGWVTAVLLALAILAKILLSVTMNPISLTLAIGASGFLILIAVTLVIRESR